MPLNTIMLVEDSESEQFLYQRKIKSYGSVTEVVPAYDGEEALELLENSDVTPDCILLDINMPRMNGFEFLEAYSKKHDLSQIVVCMLSSSGQQSDKDRALSYSCVKHYFVKPITNEDLDFLEDMIDTLRSEQ